MGVDPVWGLATAKLNFTNGIKMKLSVIMGIIHMTIGIIMKGTNACFKKDVPTLVFEVITGLIMLLGLFGWMDLLIYAKWFFPQDFMNPKVIKSPFTGQSIRMGDFYNQLVPSVINIMITTVFSGGAGPTGDATQYAMFWGYSKLRDGGNYESDQPILPEASWQNSMYNFSIFLLLLAIITIPLMLLVKPLCCRPKHHVVDADEIEFANIQVAAEDNNSLQVNDNEEAENLIQNRKRQIKSIEATLKNLAGDGGDHGFGEVFVHQMIETIEFALATVSNTASYLRLWALSLAHGQLAEVFLNLTFKMALTADGIFLTIILSVILWPIFWSITFFVLMCMD